MPEHSGHKSDRRTKRRAVPLQTDGMAGQLEGRLRQYGVENTQVIKGVRLHLPETYRSCRDVMQFVEDLADARDPRRALEMFARIELEVDHLLSHLPSLDRVLSRTVNVLARSYRHKGETAGEVARRERAKANVKLLRERLMPAVQRDLGEG